ncbi:MAG TPA: hypothetical protein PLB41_06070 [Rubrivivax sp.]|nr:hypothetical protein [Rubrivivax sp.]HPO19542.1 hypothetical protein [Rubrivivax sp.]
MPSNAPPLSRTTALSMLVGLALPALAQQGPNDVEVLTKHAGTWAVDCAQPGTRLTVSVNALTLQAAGQQQRAVAPLAAFSYFGRQAPPKGFEVALLGDAAATQLVFFVMSDKSGSYLAIQPDAPLQKQFGKAALAGKFRRCP